METAGTVKGQNTERMSMEKEQHMETVRERRAEVKRIVYLALEAGRILLKNGGEIFRVEETITRICNHFGIEKIEIFTLSHGLFLSVEDENGEVYTRVKNVPLSGAHLGIVADVNELSRQITEGKITLDEALERIKEIEKKPSGVWYYQIPAAGIAAGAFGFILGASAAESFIAIIIGCILQAWVLLAKRTHISKIVINIMGGVIITSIALIAREVCISLPLKLNGIITGGIMPLVPGLAFTNAVRDLADGDFLSGTVRMIDALLVFVYIAIGVGIALKIYTDIPGGLLI